MGQLPSAKDFITSDSTTSATYEDVDGLSVSHVVDDTSDILLFASIEAVGSVSAKAGWRLVYDGTNYLDLERQIGSEAGNICLVDRIASKGAGTYTFKLQHKTDGGTLTTKNATIVAVSLHNGSGSVPANSVYVASDTVGSAWEDIPSLTCDVTLSKTSHIWAMLVWNGHMSAAGKIGACLININGTDYEINEREWGTANEYGCVSVNTRTASKLTAGTYTVKGRWKGAAGATLTGEDFKLIVIAGEANSGASDIDITKTVVTLDTTTATTIEDIDGLSVTATPEESAHIFGVMTLMTDVSANNKSAYTTININATDHDVMERGHSSKLVYGSVGQVVRTASPLASGSYTVKGRWFTDSANTLSGEQIVLTSIVLAATSAAQIVEIAGTSAGQSALSVQYLELLSEIIGSSSGQSGTSVNLGVNYPLSGLVAGESLIPLIPLKRSFDIIGSLGGQSGADGALIIFAQVLLSGTVSGQSNIPNTDIKLLMEIIGTSDAQSGTDVNLGVAYSVLGDISGQSGTTVSLDVLRELIGSLAGQSGVIGDLTIIGGLVLLAGSTAGQSNISYTALEILMKITGTADAQSGVDGGIKLTMEIIGTSDATSSTDATLKAIRTLSGDVDVVSSLSAALQSITYLLGTVSGTSGTDGGLKLTLEIVGTVDGESTVLGTVTVTSPYEVSITQITSMMSDLITKITISDDDLITEIWTET